MSETFMAVTYVSILLSDLSCMNYSQHVGHNERCVSPAFRGAFLRHCFNAIRRKRSCGFQCVLLIPGACFKVGTSALNNVKHISSVQIIRVKYCPFADLLGREI